MPQDSNVVSSYLHYPQKPQKDLKQTSLRILLRFYPGVAVPIEATANPQFQRILLELPKPDATTDATTTAGASSADAATAHHDVQMMRKQGSLGLVLRDGAKDYMCRVCILPNLGLSLNDDNDAYPKYI